MSKPRVVAGLAVFLFVNLAMSSSAAASTATAAMTVSATYLANCTVVAAPLAFGNYSAGQLDGMGAVTVTCTNGTSYSVGLDQGSGSGATVRARKMTGTSNGALSYSLYQDASRSVVWGNTPGTNTASATGTGIPQVMNAYGRILAGQTPAPGAFIDTVVVTVTY